MIIIFLLPVGCYQRQQPGGRPAARAEGLPQEHAYDLIYRHGLDADASGKRLAMGYVNVESLRADLAWFADHGYIPDPPNLDRVIDMTYVDYAMARLGPYAR